MNPWNILVLPISGGAFPSQLGLLCHLTEVKYQPDIILSSSGGNASAYIALAGDWSSSGIRRLSRTVNSQMFLSSWLPPPFPSQVVGFLKGSLYNHGLGVRPLVDTYFTPSTITRTEIWTETYNRTRHKGRLFCNRSQENAIIKDPILNEELTQSLSPVYMKGDFDLIAEVSVASASIPTLVPPVYIEGEPYVDGGVSSASPLTPMQNAILDLAAPEDVALHVTYVSSSNLETLELPTVYLNLITNGRMAASELVRSMMIADRMVAYSFLRDSAIEVYNKNFPCTRENLLEVQKLRSRVPRTLLELYPEKYHELELSSFTGTDVLHLLQKGYEGGMCRLYWINHRTS